MAESTPNLRAPESLAARLPLSKVLLDAWECTTFEDFGRVFPQSEQTCSACHQCANCYELPDADFPQIKYHLCLTCFAHVLVAWCALVDEDEPLFHKCDESLAERFRRIEEAQESNAPPN